MFGNTSHYLFESESNEIQITIFKERPPKRAANINATNKNLAKYIYAHSILMYVHIPINYVLTKAN